MSLTVSDAGRESGAFTPAPAGTHLAICYLLADLGLQETAFGPKDQCYIAWELPHCPLEKNGKNIGPATVGGFYTLSMNEKANLRLMLESWRGRPFTEAEIAQGVKIASVVGRACTLTIVHKQSKTGRTFAKIVSVGGVMMGVSVPPQHNESVIFDRDNGRGLEKLPEWLQKKVRSEPTTAPDAEHGGSHGDIDDEIPF